MYHNAFLVVMSCLKDTRKNKTNHVKHSEHSKIAATKRWTAWKLLMVAIPNIGRICCLWSCN